MGTAQQEFLKKVADDDRGSFRYRRERDRYRKTPGIRTRYPSRQEIRALQKRPIVGDVTNQKTRKFEAVRGREIQIKREVLAEIGRQAISPYKATQVGNFTRDPAFSAEDFITYRRGNDYVISIDDRHSKGGTDMNMGDTGSKGMTKLNSIMDAIVTRNPNAGVMTTGGSIGANVVNSSASHMMKNAVSKTTKWASNR